MITTSAKHWPIICQSVTLLASSFIPVEILSETLWTQPLLSPFCFSTLVFWAPTGMAIQLYLAHSLGFPAHIPIFFPKFVSHTSFKDLATWAGLIIAMALISGTINLDQLISFTGATILNNLKDSWFQRVSVLYGEDAMETQAHGQFVGPQVHERGCLQGRRPGSRQHGRTQGWPLFSRAIPSYVFLPAGLHLSKIPQAPNVLPSAEEWAFKTWACEVCFRSKPQYPLSLSWLPLSTSASPASPILSQGDKVDWNVSSIFWVRHFKTPMILGNPSH